MKILYISIIVLLESGLIACTTNAVYAPCPVGVTDCGPPPGVKVSMSADSQFYGKNDTINIQGQVYVQNYSKPIHIQVINSDNATIQSIDTPVVDGKFGLKIRVNFDTTGDYHIATCVQGWCDGWFFKFVAEPYKLTVNGQDFFIKYKSFADLVGMEADIKNNALRVHIVNATAQGEQFVIELPRALIDSKGYDGKDASFRVLLGMHQPDKYMQPANFTEIASNDLSRKLAINIPYEPVPNSSGMWDFKIMPANTGSGPSVNYESPLRQFKSGVAADDVKCGQGLQLVIKTKDGSPACARPHTAQKLVERKWGWAMQPVNSIKPLPYRIINSENNTEMITFDNQTYYSEIPNYNETSYVHPMLISFHDVNFTLFPPGFRGGLPVGGCSGQYYWTDVKFADGTAELLHVYGGSQSCADSVPIMLSNHILPQAGLTFSDGKIRLLVRDENQAGKNIVLQKPSSTEEPFPHCNSSPAKEKLIREKQQILTDVLEDEEKKYGGFENRTQNLPWSTIGYDCIDNALEAGILPHYFNSDLLPKYFEKIRSIVGNTIDVALSPEDYATPV